MKISLEDIVKFAGLSFAGILLNVNLEAREEEAKGSTGADSPNILFILTDDQGWSDLSESLDPGEEEAFCDYFHTPNMNKLFDQGMRFTQAYAPAPICTPSRRSIQFGMTPARQHGTEFLGSFDPKGKWSIAEALKKANSDYQCAHFGKWGGVITGTWRDRESQMLGHPKNNGYDEHDGMSGNGTGTFYMEERFRNWVCAADSDPKRTPSVTSRAISFMKRQAEEGSPFYLQVSYYAIHTAFQAKEGTMNRYANKEKPERYVPPGIGPMLEELDAGIGRLIDALDEFGVRDDTYIFFTSDNGGTGHGRQRLWENDARYDSKFLKRSKLVDSQPQYETEPVSRNHPLFRHKQWLYEGGIRVPFAVVGPGIESSSVCRVPVTGWDLLPTFYDLAGGTGKLPQKVDGGSMRELLIKSGNGQIVRPVEGLVFHRPTHRNNRPGHSAIRLDKYKLLLFWTKDGEIARRELYDLSRDIGEQNDLSEEMPRKTQKLQEQLLQYLREVDNIPD